MAEFVEHGGDVVESEQLGLASRRLHEIRDVIDDGLGAEKLRLSIRLLIQAPPDLLSRLK